LAHGRVPRAMKVEEDAQIIAVKARGLQEQVG